MLSPNTEEIIARMLGRKDIPPKLVRFVEDVENFIRRWQQGGQGEPHYHTTAIAVATAKALGYVTPQPHVGLKVTVKMPPSTPKGDPRFAEGKLLEIDDQGRYYVELATGEKVRSLPINTSWALTDKMKEEMKDPIYG